MDAWWFQTLFCLGCFNTYLAVSWHRYFVDPFPTETHRFSLTLIYCLKLINFHQSPVILSSLVRCMLWINKVGCDAFCMEGMDIWSSTRINSKALIIALPPIWPWHIREPRNPRTGDSPAESSAMVLGTAHGSISLESQIYVWYVHPQNPEEMGWSIHQPPPKASQFRRYISFPTVGKHRPEKRQSPCQVPADCCWPWREVRRRRGCFRDILMDMSPHLSTAVASWLIDPIKLVVFNIVISYIHQYPFNHCYSDVLVV